MGLIDKEPELLVDKLKEDMFYDLCSSSGWSREEIDEMGVKPEELELDEWEMSEFTDYVCKWLSKVTSYYVEYHDKDDKPPYFSFHNAVYRILANFAAVTEKAEEAREALNQQFEVPASEIEKTLDWAVNEVIRIAKDVPEMKLPEEKMAVFR